MMEIFLYQFDTSRPHKHLDKLLARLPPKEHTRVAKFRLWQDKQRTCLGRHVLLYLFKHLNLPFQLSEILLSPFGKPILPGFMGDFNISHSHGIVMCGLVLDGRIGVDVEKLVPLNYEELARQSFSPEEVSELGSCLDDKVLQQQFFHIWTMKEAYTKAVGRGFSIPPQSFSCLPHHEGYSVKTVDSDSKKWNIFSHIINQHYCVSVCYSTISESETVEKKIKWLSQEAFDDFLTEQI